MKEESKSKSTKRQNNGPTNFQRKRSQELADILAKDKKNYFIVYFGTDTETNQLLGDFYFQAQSLEQFAHYLLNVASQRHEIAQMIGHLLFRYSELAHRQAAQQQKILRPDTKIITDTSRFKK